MSKKIIAIILLFAAISWGGYSMRDKIFPLFFTPQERPAGIEDGLTLEDIEDPEIFADNLEIPWELVFLSDQEILVTERPGRVLLIGNNRREYVIDEVDHIGEGGLLGMAKHPDFEENDYLKNLI